MFWLARSRAPVKGLGLPLSKADILQRGRSGFSQKNKAAHCACKPSRCPLWLFSDSFCSTQKHAVSHLKKSLPLRLGSLHSTAALSFHTNWMEFLLPPFFYLSFFPWFSAIWLLPPPFYWNPSHWVSSDLKIASSCRLVFSFLTSSNWLLWSSFLKKKNLERV